MQTTFEGELTARDCKRCLPFRFEVPEGCGVLEIDLTFEPDRVQGIANRLTLSLFDPNGFRGAGHRGGAAHHVRIDGQTATPGYLPGPLPVGTWMVEIDTHMIMPGPPVRYRLAVEGHEGSRVSADRPAESQGYGGGSMARGGAGWYRGDLHTHSHHSDAKAFTVGDMVRLARTYALDFFFLTDHNTNAGFISGEVKSAVGAGAASDLLIGRGIELTTYWGHALCLGTDRWVDWRVRPGTGAMARIADAARQDGQVFVIAHPMSDGDPGCTGCAWRFGEMMPGSARFVEIWNGPWGGDSNNETNLALWYDWLNQGLRMIATAGTDVHGKVPDGVAPGFNVIYAEALSEPALLDGLRAGHCYLSAGPTLRLEAEDADGERVMMGDMLDQPATFHAAWKGTQTGGTVRVLVNGRLLSKIASGTDGDIRWDMNPTDGAWVVVEVRGEDGDLLVVTNPIFLQLDEAEG